jgi:hypothetical protein
MNDILKENFNALLVYLTDIVKQGADFASENVPIWIQQILSFYGIRNIIFTSVAFLFLVISTIFVVKTFKYLNNSDDDEIEGCVIVLTFLGGVGIASFFLFIHYLSSVIMIYTAPMLFLMKLVGITI